MMSADKPKEMTREAQYEDSLLYRDQHGQERLGLMINQSWYDDPKRLAFTFARYKFASKMLSGCHNVLEVGCSDAFASRIVLQEVGRLSVTDFDPLFVEDIHNRMVDKWKYADAFVHDLLKGPIANFYDGIYALDVLEHINPADEPTFLSNMVKSLEPYGTMIVGMPTLQSQAFASPKSKAGHINCQTLSQLKSTMQGHFHNVYMFCMNDEVVHTGFDQMAQYIFALCCGKK